MRNINRVIWLVTLCCFVSGCSTYRRVDSPTIVIESDSGDHNDTISSGANLRVTLLTGEVVLGQVVWVTNDEIALSSRGNYGYENRIVKVAEIEFVEVRDQSDSQIERRWFLGLGAAAVISIFIGLRNWELN